MDADESEQKARLRHDLLAAACGEKDTLELAIDEESVGVLALVSVGVISVLLRLAASARQSATPADIAAEIRADLLLLDAVKGIDPP